MQLIKRKLGAHTPGTHAKLQQGVEEVVHVAASVAELARKQREMEAALRQVQKSNQDLVLQNQVA